MARNFNSVNPDFLRGSAVVTAAPFSVSVWARCTDESNDRGVWYIGRSGSTNDFWAMRFNDTGSGHTIRYRVSNGGATNVETAATWTLNEWHHIGVVEAASDDRRLYLDGGNKVTNSTSRTPNGGIDRTSVGRFDDVTPDNNYDGDIAHFAVWNVALTDAEMATLAAGISPLRVRRGALIAYWPLGGQSPEPDIVGGLGLTLNGTPAQAEEPPIPHSVVAPG